MTIENRLVQSPGYRLLEEIEMSCWEGMFKSMKPVNSKNCSADYCKCHDSLLHHISGLDILAFNRVIGLGIVKPITKHHLSDIIAYYSKYNVPRFFVPIVEEVLDGSTNNMLRDMGFVAYNKWTKLYRKADIKIPPVNSRLRLRRVKPEEALIYGNIITKSFEWPEYFAPFIASTVGKKGYAHFFALSNHQPVAAAALYMNGGMASMALAGTLHEYRGYGAQSLFLSERIRMSQAQGCRWIVSETAEELPDKPVSSYRNMIRFGFKPAYHRPNFIYQFT